MAGERQHKWTVSKHSGAKPTLTVTLELVTIGLETREVLETASWRAVYELRADGGRVAISEIQLRPTTPGELRRLPAQLARELLIPGRVLEIGRIGLLDVIVHENQAERESRQGRLPEYHGLDPAQLRADRRGKRQPDYFYAVLAARYVEAHSTGSRRPVADVAAQLPAANTPPFVRDVLSKARARGLLERSAGQRRAGGALTPRGRQVLQDGPPDDYVGPLPPAGSWAPGCGRGTRSTGTNTGTSRL